MGWGNDQLQLSLLAGQFVFTDFDGMHMPAKRIRPFQNRAEIQSPVDALDAGARHAACHRFRGGRVRLREYHRQRRLNRSSADLAQICELQNFQGAAYRLAAGGIAGVGTHYI